MRSTALLRLIGLSIALTFLSGCAGGCKQEPIDAPASDAAAPVDSAGSETTKPIPRQQAPTQSESRVKSANEHRNEAKARINVDNVNSELNVIEREINALEKRLEKSTRKDQ